MGGAIVCAAGYIALHLQNGLSVAGFDFPGGLPLMPHYRPRNLHQAAPERLHASFQSPQDWQPPARKPSLFNALPTSRPARTGPPADSEQPIAPGVNFDKGVYVIRQLTPPFAQRTTSTSPWQTQALVSSELDQGPSSGRTVLKPRQARLAGANVRVQTGWPQDVDSILPGLVPHRQAVELFPQVLPMR